VAASWATPVTSGWPRAGWKLGPGPSASLNSGPRLLPASVSGWIALGLFGLSILLLLARLALTPAFGLPFNYLIVFTAMAASGLVAVLAVALQHERSIGVFVTLLFGLLAGAFLLAEALGGSGTNPSVTLGESDNGKTVTVSAGTSILLQLPGNPSTGYDWEVTIGNPSVLEQSGTRKFTPSSSAMGAGGTYNFWFQPKTAGRTDLTLVYRRSWETGVAPLKTYKITIAVQ
jgi:inhibitor of cysteine peptidase